MRACVCVYLSVRIYCTFICVRVLWVEEQYIIVRDLQWLSSRNAMLPYSNTRTRATSCPWHRAKRVFSVHHDARLPSPSRAEQREISSRADVPKPSFNSVVLARRAFLVSYVPLGSSRPRARHTETKQFSVALSLSLSLVTDYYDNIFYPIRIYTHAGGHITTIIFIYVRIFHIGVLNVGVMNSRPRRRCGFCYAACRYTDVVFRYV